MTQKKGEGTRKSPHSVLRIKIWGTRGSLPTPSSPTTLEKQLRDLLNDFLAYTEAEVKKDPKDQIESFLAERPRYKLGGYGGNTPCVEIQSSGQQLIIDGGSGIRPLGYEMMNGPCALGRGEVHLLFTHFHWDHLIGLPFFTPLFIPGNKIHVYAVQPELPDIFQILFKKPFFPVPFANLGATFEFHRLEPRKPLHIGDIQVTPYGLDHPDPCWGFKIEKEGKVYSHCVDTESSRVSRAELGPDLPLYQGVDLMVFDSQYTIMETIEKVNWGHATASLGLDIAMREGIKRVVFMHYDPASSPDKIAAAEAQARSYYENQLKRATVVTPPLHPVDWCFGHEGMVLEL